MHVSRRRGFTVIEMVVTLALIGIIASITIPRIDMSRLRGDAGLRILTTTLLQAQRTALTRQHNVIVSIDQATNRIRLVEDRNNSATVDAGERSVWFGLERPVTFTPAAAPLNTLTGTVVLTRPRTIGGFPSVIFRRNGAASSDMALFITAKPGDAQAMRAAYVYQGTGRTESFRYGPAGWVRIGG